MDKKKPRKRDKDHTAFYKWLKQYGIELEELKKRIGILEKHMEQIAWFCQSCNEWHPKGMICAVDEVRKVREERY